MDITWHREVDVVVAGYGLAGSVAAMVAHDAGARVLILEKGQYPGGVSILAGGAIKCARDAEKATKYLVALSGGRVEEELLRVFAQYLTENAEFLKELAQVDGAKVQRMETVSGGGLFSQGAYPLPGREALYSVRVAEVPGFQGFPWLLASRRGGPQMMKLFFDNVEARGIEVSLSTPVKRLLTDPGGAVIGVVAEKDGQEVRVRARRGVVLATGGFEQNPWMHWQFLQGKPFYSMAPLTHTGDGILMAQKVGAALWHMWHVHGSYGFKLPGNPIALRHPFGGHRNPNRTMPWIVVDKFGRRYMDEYPPCPQDTAHRPMELFDPDLPGYPRIPSFMVFDEEGRKWGPVAHPLFFVEHRYEWSQDNLREVEKGWIVKGETLRELAAKLRALPENEARMEPEVLEETVAAWNEAMKKGKDPLGRPPKTMMPIKNPPFYGIAVWPIITNTQGGPVHNARQQVVDALGQPIPRLYAVGELGSIFAHLYEVEGNLGECITSGRIAGACCAAEEPLP